MGAREGSIVMGVGPTNGGEGEDGAVGWVANAEGPTSSN